jgi:hypothetical protein
MEESHPNSGFINFTDSHLQWLIAGLQHINHLVDKKQQTVARSVFTAYVQIGMRMCSTEYNAFISEVATISGVDRSTVRRYNTLLKKIQLVSTKTGARNPDYTYKPMGVRLTIPSMGQETPWLSMGHQAPYLGITINTVIEELQNVDNSKSFSKNNVKVKQSLGKSKVDNVVDRSKESLDKSSSFIRVAKPINDLVTHLASHSPHANLGF